MVATVNTMALVAVHSYPSPTSVTTNLNPTVISTAAITQKQQVINTDLTPNNWKYIIKLAGAAFITRSISETLALAESVKRKITRLIPVFQLYDDFESGTYTYSAEPQASPNGKWTLQFAELGTGGSAGVHTPTSSTDTTLVAFQTPQVATSSGVTHSALVVSNTNYTDFTLEVDVRTIAQIRTGSAPNNWEVAWIYWHWTDNSHQYYFTPKMSGVELGKVDGNGQIILDTPGTPFTLTLGQWYHLKVVVVGNHFKTWINGTLYNDYVDTGVGGFPSANNSAPSTQLYSGKLGMYCEDSQVEFDNWSATPTEGFFLKEPAPYQYPIKLIPKITGETIHLAESVLRKVIPHIAETLHLTESILRKVIRKLAESVTLTESDKRKPIPHIAETITLTETSIKKKVFKPISEALHLAESVLRKPIPHIAGETITLTESDKRKVIPHIAEALTLSESVKKKVFKPISETLHLAESVLRRVIPNLKYTNISALNFVRSSNQFVDCTNNSLLTVGETPGSEASYSAWFKISANPAGSAGLCGKSVAFPGSGMAPFVSSLGTLDCDFNFHTASSDFPSTGVVVTDGKWHHMVCSNKATGNSQLFLDGVQYVSDANNDYLVPTAAGATFQIGQVYGGGGLAFNGQIDDVKVYNVQLTAAEVAYTFKGGDVTRGQVAHWTFDENTGTTTKDIVNGIVGTLTNTPTWYTTSLPPINRETLNLVESIIRKPIPHIAEVLTLSESKLRKVIRPKSETLTLAESISAHKLFKRAISETLSLVESILRKPIPHIAESITLSESVKKKAFKPISETLHLAESVLRKPIPHIAGETLTLSESVRKKAIKPISETLHVAETVTRNAIRPVSETMHLVESILRKVIPKISETLHLAESVVAGKVGAIVENVSEALGFAEHELRKVIPYIGRNITIVTVFEPLNLTELVTRRTKPKITETLSLVESVLRKPIPHITGETIHLSESVKRKLNKFVSESITLADILKIGGQFVIMINESLTLTESVLRKPKHSISESLHLSETPQRRVIPHIAGEVLALSESFLRRTIISITETIQVTENHIRRIMGHGMRRFDYIFPERLTTPKRYYIEVKESTKLDENVETDQSGPSYLWKFSPVWKALGRKTK